MTHIVPGCPNLPRFVIRVAADTNASTCSKSAGRDHLAAADIAHMCGTSRPRATRLLQRQIELFNSESLIDILFRMGVVLALKINVMRAYRRTEVDNPRACRRLVEPWRA